MVIAWYGDRKRLKCRHDSLCINFTKLNLLFFNIDLFIDLELKIISKISDGYFHLSQDNDEKEC